VFFFFFMKVEIYLPSVKAQICSAFNPRHKSGEDPFSDRWYLSRELK